MKLPFLATSLHPQQFISSFCFLVIKLFTTMTLITSSPSVSNFFSDYYSKEATDAMLITDTHFLADLVTRYEEYLTEKMTIAGSNTVDKLWEIMTDSFASNDRLREAINTGPKKRKMIAENLADLLNEVNLFGNEDLFEKIRDKSQQAKKPFLKEITLYEEDGFSEKVMEILFGKTGHLRKGFKSKELSSSLNIVQSNSTLTLHYTVSPSEVIDEIVWLCLLRNCVYRSKIYSPGMLRKIVSSQNAQTEELYISLYIARVKVLLYVAFLGPQMNDYFEKKTFGGSNGESKPGRCLKGLPKYGVWLGLSVLFSYVSYEAYTKWFSKHANPTLKPWSTQNPPSFPPTNGTIFGMSSGLVFSAVALLLLGCGVSYYFIVYDDSGSPEKENYFGKDGEKQTLNKGLANSVSAVVSSAVTKEKKDNETLQKTSVVKTRSPVSSLALITRLSSVFNATSSKRIVKNKTVKPDSRAVSKVPNSKAKQHKPVNAKLSFYEKLMKKRAASSVIPPTPTTSPSPPSSSPSLAFASAFANNNRS